MRCWTIYLPLFGLGLACGNWSVVDGHRRVFWRIWRRTALNPEGGDCATD